ncbi:ROK family protein [Sphingomonas sp.]|uniref:ROK family protein n=1 Tax=Sphingomonas sp. TaxID=28214 RepID=UPI001EC77ACC|nr:ROK family protein [Sphingomonas sp.]MBX3593982.1 ROK family protein [Sphingomonas sp.]
MNDDAMLLAVETGGTKLLARLVRGEEVLAERRWDTTTPAEAEAVLLAFAGDVPIAAAGIAAFGPLVVDPDAANYGEVLATPKPGWSGSNLRRALATRLAVPVAVDTDVNAAALAEATLGAGQGCANVAYVTVGTGIGAGLAMNGITLKGAMHPELGHVPVIRAPGDGLASACPFHADCVEGLAAGPAIAARTGGAPLDSPGEAFGRVADYLGQLFATLVFAWSPNRIVAGGGVMSVPGLRAAAEARMRAAIGGYGVGPAALADGFIVAPALENAGLEGALILARAASKTG